MQFEDAFEALNAGDYHRAIELFRAIAASTELALDVVNHGYTLALHRAGERAELADVAFRIGQSHVVHDPASAMDYFQRALHAGLDAARTRQIGEIFEEWAGDRKPGRLTGEVKRVGHVVGSDDDSVEMLVKGLKANGVESKIFATSSTTGWFFNPVGDLVSGDFVERAEQIAESIRESGLQLVFYHGDLSDQILARVAASRPAPVQVSVNRGMECDADLFDGFVHWKRASVEHSRFASHPSSWIPPSSEVEKRQTQNAGTARQNLGIVDASTVSASFSGPTRDQMDSFVKGLVEILTRFPRHYHVFAGRGDVRAVRGMLHSEGVLPRIRFLAPGTDVGSLLDAIDVYLEPFPSTEPAWPVLDVMAAGVPAVALGGSDAEELIADRQLLPRSLGEYIQVADKLLRNADHRSRSGEAMRQRFENEFSVTAMGKRYVEFFEKLLG